MAYIVSLTLSAQAVGASGTGAVSPRSDVRFDEVVPGFPALMIDENGFPKGSGFAGPNRWGQYTAYLLATNGSGQRSWRIEHLVPGAASEMAEDSTIYLLEGRDRALLIDTGAAARYRDGVDDLKTVTRYLLYLGALISTHVPIGAVRWT